MLVCLQCQFHNPDQHHFCQRCGFSLQQQICSSCGASVAPGQTLCQQCGQIAISIWRVIISYAAAPPPVAVDPNVALAGQRTQQRYRPLTALMVPTAVAQDVQGLVCDTQPLQVTPIQELQQKLHLYQGSGDLTHPQAFEIYKQSEPAFPPLAWAYLSLQLQFPRTIPTLHDAWIAPEEAAQVLLLSDHSSLPELAQYWQDTVLPAGQLLRWLDEMTDLWQSLAIWGCCASLLRPGNLRVVQGQYLCVQQLYQGEPASVAQLSEIWRNLLAVKACPELDHLQQQLQQMTITSIEQLQALLPAASRDWTTGNDPNPEPDMTLPCFITDAQGWSGGDTPTGILPHQLIQLEARGKTDRGRDRPHNEDYFLIHQQHQQLSSPAGNQVHVRGLYILCDGMGGHAQGEVASSLAAKTLLQSLQIHLEAGLPDIRTLGQAIAQANQAIFAINEQKARSGSGRMGTTLVAVLIEDMQVQVAHVGDSRLYRLTPSRGLEKMTQDHEVGQREINRGIAAEIAYARSDAHQLTQALGPRNEQWLNPDIQSFDVDEDTVLLLCSDGLTDNDLLERYLLSHLQPLLDFTMPLEQGLPPLIDLANQVNGYDNITVVAIRMQVRSQLPLEILDSL